MKQDYNHYRFYYWPHHFFLYGCIGLSFALCAFGFWKYEEQRMLWAMMAAVIFLVLALAFITRQHYALGNQNRIVRLELRLRYYILTGKRFEEIEAKLSFGKLAALRFAPDEEFPALVERAVTEKLSSDQIKRSIKNWLPDTMRV
jgi:hypothetical protein